MGKNANKIMILTIISVILLTFNSIKANAEWREDSTGWWYSRGSSWITGLRQIDGKSYYFGTDGYMKTGWIYFDNFWRYFYSNGEMAQNTVVDGYVIGKSGFWTESEATTQSELEYYKNLAYQNVGDISDDEDLIFDACYTKQNYPYRNVLNSMNINDNIIYAFEIIPKNKNNEYEPTKILIGKDSKNIYEATAGLSLYQWSNKQKVKSFKYIS